MDARKTDLEKRFDDIGWGLLFLGLASLALPRGTGLFLAFALVGTAMLALNGMRLALGLPVRWFSVVLGATGLVAGSLAMADIRVDAVAVFFVILGVITIGAAIVRSPHETATA